jgi:selenocysteine lyase/cysteine desulfurase
VGVRVRKAADDFLDQRMFEVGTPWARENARDAAVQKFARLINAEPIDIAVVPSTTNGENLVGVAVGLNANAGVVTDVYHYASSLVIYGELHKRGMPLAVATAKDNRISLADIDALITKKTRLVAVSLVASDTGHFYDLKALCDIAHRKGALVYADIIQAAGAVPIDVKASGVDFCCCGTYKWLMGDFGTAFLYVRPDRLPQLKRDHVGWRQIKELVRHTYPFDPPGPAIGDWTLGTDTTSLFEVATADFGGLAMVSASLDSIAEIGVETIARHRQPLLDRLQEELPKRGFGRLTPVGCQSPIVAFSYENPLARLGPPLKAANVRVQLGANRVRISPSIYNDMSDIDRLLAALPA